MISRAERTPFSDWAWTIDRWLLAAIALLIISGLVFAMAGSPPVAERLHLATFHFVNRQVAYLFPALAVMLAASLLSPRHVRRAALVIFLLSLGLVIATLFLDKKLRVQGGGCLAFSRRSFLSLLLSSWLPGLFQKGRGAKIYQAL